MKRVHVDYDPDALAAVCRRWCVRRLSLFGSVLRDDFGPNSDVDVLVEFEPGRAPTLISVERLRQELAAVFGGRRIDLATPDGLSPHVREAVLATAQVRYAA